MIVDVINELADRIEYIYGFAPVIVNEVPAVFDEGMIYIIYPPSQEIQQTYCISNGMWEEFTVRIVYVAHEVNMNRQKTLVGNIVLGANRGYDILTKILPRFQIIARYNAYQSVLGTDTWEANSRVYTCLSMRVFFKGVLYL